MAPERLLADAPPAPLLDRHAQRAARAVANCVPTLDRVLAADLPQLFGKDRALFDPVSVGADDWMVEPRLDLCCREMNAHRGLLVRKLTTRRYRRLCRSATGAEQSEKRVTASTGCRPGRLRSRVLTGRRLGDEEVAV